jgi:hypothetical protein
MSTKLKAADPAETYFFCAMAILSVLLEASALKSAVTEDFCEELKDLSAAVAGDAEDTIKANATIDLIKNLILMNFLQCRGLK